MAFYKRGELINTRLKSYDALIRTEKNITVKFNQIEEDYDTIKCCVLNEGKEPLLSLYEVSE